MPSDWSDYNLKYQRENITRKSIKFNKLNPADVKLLAHLELQKNFSAYCKNLIRMDMDKQSENNDKQ